jgi:DNA-binding IclR family transcriptional regulator
MTLADISDATDLSVADLGAYLDELVDHGLVETETTVDGFDVFRFPADNQRGTMAP